MIIGHGDAIAGRGRADAVPPVRRKKPTGRRVRAVRTRQTAVRPAGRGEIF